MSVIRDALAYLADSTTRANKAVILQLPGDGRKAAIDQNGMFQMIDVSPAVRGHEVSSVADLCTAVGKWNDAPVVWIAKDKVVLVTNDADRRDRVTLNLKKSDAFVAVEALVKDNEFDQPAMIRALRLKFIGAEKRAELLTAIRSLKWRQSSEGFADVQHGKESLGKSVESEVTGSGSIPELVVITCPVFSNPGEEENEVGIGCDLDINPAEQTFSFQPIAGEIDAAVASALDDIRKRIEAACPTVLVLFGAP